MLYQKKTDPTPAGANAPAPASAADAPTEPPGAGDVDALLATLAEALDRQASADRAVDSTVASLYQISKGPYLLRGRSVAIMMGRNKKPVLKFPKAPLGGK